MKIHNILMLTGAALFGGVVLGLVIILVSDAKGQEPTPVIGIAYEYDPIVSMAIGDATCDLEITALDALVILRDVAHMKPYDYGECPQPGTIFRTVYGFPSCYEDEYIYFNDFPHLRKGLKCVHIDWIFCDLLQGKWDANQNELELIQDGLVWLWENDDCLNTINR